MGRMPVAAERLQSQLTSAEVRRANATALYVPWLERLKTLLVLNLEWKPLRMWCVAYMLICECAYF